MKLSEEGWTYLGYAVMLAVLFGLVAGTIVISVAEQNKLALILGNGIYIENQGGGHYLLKNGESSTTRGVGMLISNIPMMLPVGKCYQLLVNQTQLRNFTIDLNEAPSSNCP